MRKYTFLVLAVALLFAVGMMAQTSSGSSGSSSQYPSSSDQSGSSSQMGSSGSAGGKTISGCVVRRATEFYIYPASGQPEHVASSGQDVSAHLGHQVKVHGTEQPSTSASTSGTSGSAAGTGAGAAAGSSADTAGQDLIVDRVDMISTNCPASITGNAQASGMSTSPQ